MKRLALAAAAVLGFLSVAAFVAPSADAAAGQPCSGLRIHLSLNNNQTQIVDLCLPDDLGL
ncbi:MAG TPA: hypothetical protein VHC63_02785 [Acidimicrobiales bacterium]|nr:hypothetical protein [Acidimicrobiales bacterium]